MADEDTPEQLLALWRDAVARSRSAVTEVLVADVTWAAGPVLLTGEDPPR